MFESLKEFHSSSNGDRWFLGRDEATLSGEVVHRANVSSGGTVTHIEVGAFLGRSPGAPETAALLRLIGTLVDAKVEAKPA